MDTRVKPEYDRKKLFKRRQAICRFKTQRFVFIEQRVGPAMLSFKQALDAVQAQRNCQATYNKPSSETQQRE